MASLVADGGPSVRVRALPTYRIVVMLRNCLVSFVMHLILVQVVLDAAIAKRRAKLRRSHAGGVLHRSVECTRHDPNGTVGYT